jgi:hypothetical protein
MSTGDVSSNTAIPRAESGNAPSPSGDLLTTLLEMGLGAAWAALAVVLAAGTDVAGATAQPSPDRLAVELEVIGACPDRATLERLLGELLAGDEGRGAKATILDRGPHYRVAVGERALTLDDPARDCAARARQAAVFVAGELRAHPRVLGPPVWTIEKGVVFDVAPGSTGPAWAPGAEFRGALGSGAWSLVGSAGARGPATLSFHPQSGANGSSVNWKAEMLRFPLDAGARYTIYRGRFRPWFVLAGSLTPTSFLGVNVVDAERQWRVDLGLLGMVGATLRLTRHLGVAAAINLRWQPRPYHLDVSPHGMVGETPTWWLGLSLNYTLDGEASSP